MSKDHMREMLGLEPHPFGRKPEPNEVRLFEITTMNRTSSQPINQRIYIAVDASQALEAHAPDPAEGATFSVRYIGIAKDVRS